MVIVHRSDINIYCVVVTEIYNVASDLKKNIYENDMYSNLTVVHE